jgi:DNA sulfur modification protein DndB
MKNRGLASDNDYSFTALRGIQAQKEYFAFMCPLKLVPRIFLFDEDELPAELRAQRVLNKARIPEMSSYLVNNQSEYIFSSITASVDGEIRFEPLSDEFEELVDQGLSQNVGRLVIPMTNRFIINDGQHRRAAIEDALKERPSLGDESISIVLFVDHGLKRSQQMFADLNKHAIRPTKSLGILYDHRDPLAVLARKIVEEVDVFNGMTDLEKTSISNRSPKLFTLNSIYQATRDLLQKTKKDVVTTADGNLAIEFWSESSENMPDWQLAKKKELSPAALRSTYVHAHGVCLVAIGRMGNALINAHPRGWKSRLAGLKSLDWSKSNTDIWDGVLHNGKISKSGDSLARAEEIIKTSVGLG